MSGITLDGKFTFAATNGTGKFYAFDVKKKKLGKSFEIGSGPVQTVSSPDVKYVFVPLSGGGALAVVSASNWSLVKTIPNVGCGAHGVYFGKNTEGG